MALLQHQAAHSNADFHGVIVGTSPASSSSAPPVNSDFGSDTAANSPEDDVDRCFGTGRIPRADPDLEIDEHPLASADASRSDHDTIGSQSYWHYCRPPDISKWWRRRRKRRRKTGSTTWEWDTRNLLSRITGAAAAALTHYRSPGSDILSNSNQLKPRMMTATRFRRRRHNIGPMPCSQTNFKSTLLNFLLLLFSLPTQHPFVHAQFQNYPLHCSLETTTMYDDNFVYVDLNTRMAPDPGQNYATANIDFTSFGGTTTGCKPGVQTAMDCCALCAQYWPSCVSWLWIKDPDPPEFPVAFVQNCCLKTSFRVGKKQNNNFESGYFTSRCAITGDCDIQIYGQPSLSLHNFQDTDKVLITDFNHDCENGTVTGEINSMHGTDEFIPYWGDGLPNNGTTFPRSGTTSFTHVNNLGGNEPLVVQRYDMGFLSIGNVNDYKICYSTDPTATRIEQFNKTHGSLIMSGPYPEIEHNECTLGVLCLLTFTGFKIVPDQDLPPTNVPVVHYIMIQDPVDQCGTASPTVVAWTNAINPRLGEDTAFDNTFKLSNGALGGPTGFNYTVCYAADPTAHTLGVNAYQHYVLNLGTFFMNGPNQKPEECTMAQDCKISITGAGFDTFNAVLVIFGAASFCGNQYGTKAVFGDKSENPTAVDGAPYFVDINPTTKMEYEDFNLKVFTTGHTNQPGNAYKICWSGVPAQTPPLCSTGSCLASYNIQLGIFTINGPVKKPTTCTMTYECTLDLTGYGLASVSNIAIASVDDECGASNDTDIGGHDWQGTTWQNPGHGIPSYTSSTAATYRMGLASYGTARLDYRLCWSGNSSTDFAEYRMEIGTIQIGGPLVHAYGSFECTMGETCQLNVNGVNLAGSNRLLVLEEGQACGNMSGVTRVPLYGDWTNPQQATSAPTLEIVNFQRARSGIPGTNYPLCWTHITWTDDRDFKFYVGDLRMKGPYPQTTYCTMGIPCIVTLSGIDLNANNFISFIQKTSTCGDLNPTTVAWSNFNEIVQTSTAAGTTFNTGTGAQTGPPGEYTLCWVDNPTNSALLRYYYTTIGSFFMYGPTNPVAFACELSLECTVSLTGTGLTGTNSILIIHYQNYPTNNNNVYCGDPNAVPVDWRGITNPTNVIWDNVFQTYFVGGIYSGVVGQYYRLCWSYHATVNTTNRTLTNVADYDTEVGMFTLRGVNYKPQVTCTLGELCQVSITGVNLAATQQVAVVKADTECGEPGVQLEVFPGMPNPQTTLNDGIFQTFNMQTPILGVPGDYRLCYSYNPPASTDPAYLETFKFEISPFRMVGPDQVDKECYLSLPCQIPVTGTDLAPTNKIVIINRLSNCGDTSPILHRLQSQSNPTSTTLSAISQTDTYDTGTPIAGIPGINGKVCWAHNPSSTTAYQDYKVNLGFFSTFGPNQKILRCMDGTYGIQQVAGLWRVSCTVWTNEQVTVEQDLNDGGAYKVLSGLYKDWYLYETSTTGVSHLGTLFVVNPARVPQTNYWYEIRGPTVACTLGQACTTVLEGYGLQATNGVYVITSSQDCGSATATPSAMIGLTNPRQVSDDDYDNQYRLGIVTVGGSYVNCNVLDPSNTCIGNHYKLCWSANPALASGATTAYNLQVGVFEMKGPFIDYSADCFIGSYCSFAIYGTGFQSSNRLLFVKSTSTCGSSDMEIAAFAGFVNPQQAVADVAGNWAVLCYRLRDFSPDKNV